jgi:hypothetical protein
MLPSDRGKVTASQLMNVGSAAAGMEKSLTSDSMLMYLGARTPVPGANGIPNHAYGASAGGTPARGGGLEDMQFNPSVSMEAAAFARPKSGGGPGVADAQSPLSRLVAEHSRPSSAVSRNGGNGVAGMANTPTYNARTTQSSRPGTGGARDDTPHNPDGIYGRETAEETLDRLVSRSNSTTHGITIQKNKSSASLTGAGSKHASDIMSPPDSSSLFGNLPTPAHKSKLKAEKFWAHTSIYSDALDNSASGVYSNSGSPAKGGDGDDDYALGEDEDEDEVRVDASMSSQQGPGAGVFSPYHSPRKTKELSNESAANIDLNDTDIGIEAKAISPGSKWDTSKETRSEIQQRLENALRPSRGNSAKSHVSRGKDTSTVDENDDGYDSGVIPDETNDDDGADEEYYDPNEFDTMEVTNNSIDRSNGGAASPYVGPYTIDVQILSGHGIAPASFANTSVNTDPESHTGPEPFIVMTLCGKNYASQRAVGLYPDWAREEIGLAWDGKASLLVQVMDQNETETETLMSQWVDLSVMQLEEGEAMPCEVGGANNSGNNGTVQIELTLRQS